MAGAGGGGSRLSGADMGGLMEEEKGMGIRGWEVKVVITGWEANDLVLLHVGQGCMKWGNVEEM